MKFSYRIRRVGTSAWLPYLFVLLAALASLGGLAVRPATRAAPGPVDFVIIAGAAGLRWEDLDPQRTPTLWHEAVLGSIGSLSVKSAATVTCPADGWLTLGAGNHAAWRQPLVASGRCGPPTPALTQPDGIGANLTDQRTVVRDNQDRYSYGAVPGALAESVRCTSAFGPGAAIAAARPFGRVDKYQPTLPTDATAPLAACQLSIVDLGTIAGSGPTRQAQVAQVDATMGRIVAARPVNSLLLIAGVADTDPAARLHLTIAEGPGWQGGRLTSAGTGRPGYLQLVDVAPTALTALDKPLPEKLFAGRVATVAMDKASDLMRAVQLERDADQRAGVRDRVAKVFFAGLGAVQLLVFVLLVPVLVRARRHTGPRGPAVPAQRLVAGFEVALIAAALAIPAALVADALPWWRNGHPVWVFGLVTAVLIALGTLAVRLAPRYRRRLWPLGAVAAIGAAVVGLDLLTGAQLQLNGVAGYSAIQGARYAGVGDVGLGVFVAGLLVVAGCLAQWVEKHWRPVIVAVLGGLGVVMVGSPYLGADPVGAIAVTAGVSVAAAISAGGWLTFSRVAWAALSGLAVTVGFAVLDLRRAEGDQGTLGQALTRLAGGTGGPAMQRVATANGQTLLESPITILAVVGVLMLAFCQFSPWGGLNRLFGLHPALRAAGAGTTVATVIAGVLGGSALTVAGAAAAVAVPTAALTTLRVLLHAADRTRPDGESYGPGGPFLHGADDEQQPAGTAS